jgi:gamma-glutamyltranspeptidase/glutathione hydrolase
MSLSPRIALLFALLTLSLTPLAHAQTLRPEPEASTGLAQPEVVQAQHRIVVSAHPDATAAGYAVLERGGSALDAAIAVQAMLTLVEPQSSGIGGGAFLLYWDQSTGTLHAYDGREQAPAAADGDLFRQPDGTPMRWIDAVIGGRAVGAPGVLRMLELAHRAHGQLPWSELFDSAITRARDGFIVGERLHGLIAQAVNPGLGRYPEARDYFFSADGTPRPVGSRLRNPALARTLEQIARDGADAFYRGPLAQRIAARVQSVEDNPGRLTAADLAAYEAKVRTPLCRPYRQWQICGFPPPTSGGVTLLQILGLLEGYAPEQLAPDSAEFAHLFTQASRLAYADRARYLADPDYVEVPVAALLAPAYLQQRRQLIDPARDMGEAPAGALDALAWADDRSPELPSTSHFVIVDGDGNAVSMTSSIEHAFGSTLMVDGFLLNNQLTDFSFRAEQDGRPIANRVEPGKRPRSSMAPVMVFDSNGELVAALGSPGGSHIINYVAQTLVALLNSPLSLQQAIALPHVSNRNGRTALEQGRVDDALIESLRARGHEVELRDLNSGLHGVYRRPDGRWEAGVDPRREGEARGD